MRSRQREGTTCLEIEALGRDCRARAPHARERLHLRYMTCAWTNTAAQREIQRPASRKRRRGSSEAQGQNGEVKRLRGLASPWPANRLASYEGNITVINYKIVMCFGFERDTSGGDGGRVGRRSTRKS